MVCMLIILLLYIFIFCVPAFFFAYEGDPYANGLEKCGMMIMTILGFPGAIVGSIVKADKEEKREAKAETFKKQVEAEARTSEKQIRRQAALNERIKRYSESPLFPDIIKYLSQHGVPYSIYIHHNCIFASRLDGDDTYYFHQHGIQDIPRTDIGGIGTNDSELYALGCAINQAFGNRFTVQETGYDGYVSRVDLNRTLDSF